jgi:hypothetical protein
MEFFSSWWFMGIMGVICVALIGVYMFLRNQRPD